MDIMEVVAVVVTEAAAAVVAIVLLLLLHLALKAKDQWVKDHRAEGRWVEDRRGRAEAAHRECPAIRTKREAHPGTGGMS